MKLNPSIVIRSLLLALILISIAITFVSKIILKDYDIEFNPDGLPRLDE